MHRLSETNHPSESALHMIQNNKTLPTKALLGGSRFSRLTGDCSGFLSQGYRKHPRLNLWAHEGCAYFLNAFGQKLAHEYAPKMRAKSKDRGYTAPNLRNYKPRLCHVLMGEIFYGERPTFIDSKGKPYFGLCHHLIEDPLDYSPENLLCWLDYSQHRKADNRRRALEAVVPDGDLHVFTYERLRELQDPRTMSDENFQTELARIREDGFTKSNPAEQMHFECTHHMEI